MLTEIGFSTSYIAQNNIDKLKYGCQLKEKAKTSRTTSKEASEEAKEAIHPSKQIKDLFTSDQTGRSISGRYQKQVEVQTDRTPCKLDKESHCIQTNISEARRTLIYLWIRWRFASSCNIK